MYSYSCSKIACMHHLLHSPSQASGSLEFLQVCCKAVLIHHLRSLRATSSLSSVSSHTSKQTLHVMDNNHWFLLRLWCTTYIRGSDDVGLHLDGWSESLIYSISYTHLLLGSWLPCLLTWNMFKSISLSPFSRWPDGSFAWQEAPNRGLFSSWDGELHK